MIESPFASVTAENSLCASIPLAPTVVLLNRPDSAMACGLGLSFVKVFDNTICVAPEPVPFDQVLVVAVPLN